MDQQDEPSQARNELDAPGDTVRIEMRESIAISRPVNSGGNADFEQEWLDINRRSLACINHKDVDAEAYLAEQQHIEEDRRRFLDRWKDSRNLSTEQKQDITFMSKSMAYEDEGRDISRRHRENPNDPAARQAYEQREAERDGFIKAMVNDPDMGQYESVRKLGELQKQLSDAKGYPEKERAIKLQREVASYEFEQEMRQDPQLLEKAARFVDRNRENPVLQKSGTGEYVTQLAARRSRENEKGMAPDGRSASADIRTADKSPDSTVGDLIPPDALQEIRMRAQNAGLTGGMAVKAADGPSATPATTNVKSSGVTRR